MKPTIDAYSDFQNAYDVLNMRLFAVESRKGAVAAGVGVAVAGGFRQVPVPQSTSWLRFLSPLIERSVRVSRTTLSD